MGQRHYLCVDHEISWLYVAAIVDLFSRLVVGWAMGPNNDEELVRRALEMALLRRLPPAQMLLHSDQGSPYTSTGYLSRLQEQGITVSMSRTGDCYDNTAMESFFSTLKGECVERTSFASRTEVRQSIFEYIECFYVRSVQPKLAFTSEGMVGKGTTLDNS